MNEPEVQYLKDAKGEQNLVVLRRSEYERMQARLNELELLLYNKAIAQAAMAELAAFLDSKPTGRPVEEFLAELKK